MIRRALFTRFASLLTAAVLVAAGMTMAPVAQAATGDVGTTGPGYPSWVVSPTSEKPESKLWYNDGRWWAAMVNSAGAWRIYYLDRASGPESWVDAGTAIDSRSNTSTDTMWVNDKLYVASHVKASSNTAGQSGQPARLYRYSYNAATKSYALDAGYPTNINNTSSETLTIDMDSTGRVWATWTQAQSVYVNATTNDTWGTPFVLPVNNATGLDPDDISTVVSFAGRIGVLWSSQSNSAVYFAFRSPTAPITTWNPSQSVTVPGNGQADDHLNIKQVQADPSGRVFAVIKTSLDKMGASSPQVVVLGRSADGTWSRATFGTVGDCHTRPILMLDTTNNLVRVYATAPDSGCPYPGSAGTIFEKTSPMGNLSFAPGRGTPVIRDAASANMNNATSSKQSVDASTGVVVLATNDATKKYWFSDEVLASSAPVANFTVSPSSGVAPLAVAFSDTSSNGPTSWAWDFGDGATTTTQNPSHTYSAAGTYTVKLTATNAAGSNTVSKAGVVTVTGQVNTGISIVGSQSAFSDSAVTGVSVPAPSGITAGDVLVASITSDRNASMTTVPAGWTPMVNGLSINSSAGAGARIYAYYHVVGASESGSYSWVLSSKQKWGAGITAYRGVNTTTPLDTSVVTGVNSSWSGTSLTLPSITTASSNTMLIGAVGLDSGTPLAAPPSGWTQEWQAAGGQVAALADKAQPNAGASGPATWTLSSGRAFGGWRTALKPSA